MKKLSLTLILCGLLAASSGYARKSSVLVASGTITTKSFPDMGKFTTITNMGEVDVDFRQSTDGSTTISLNGSANLLDYVKVENRNGALEVKFDIPHNMVVVNERKLLLSVTSPELSMINVAGRGDVDMYGIINLKSFTANVTGSGDFNCKRITCTDNLTIMAAGSGDVEIDFMKSPSVNFTGTGSGDAEIGVLEAASANINLQGNGDFDCNTMVSADVATTTSSSGDIEIESLSAETLAVLVKSSGSVSLKGDVIDADFMVSGSGGISAMGLKAVNISASSSGSGGITCYALKSIDAKTTGSGTITYSGNPMAKKTQGNIKTK